MADKPTTAQQAKGCGCLIALLFVFWIVGKSCSDTSASGRSSAAIVACEYAVSARLRAPATADYPFDISRGLVITGDSFVLTSYVDAQNGFGAQLRTRFICTGNFSGDSVSSLPSVVLE